MQNAIECLKSLNLTDPDGWIAANRGTIYNQLESSCKISQFPGEEIQRIFGNYCHSLDNTLESWGFKNCMTSFNSLINREIHQISSGSGRKTLPIGWLLLGVVGLGVVGLGVAGLIIAIKAKNKSAETENGLQEVYAEGKALQKVVKKNKPEIQKPKKAAKPAKKRVKKKDKKRKKTTPKKTKGLSPEEAQKRAAERAAKNRKKFQPKIKATVVNKELEKFKKLCFQMSCKELEDSLNGVYGEKRVIIQEMIETHGINK